MAEAKDLDQAHTDAPKAPEKIPAPAKEAEAKINFLVWFSGALSRFPKLKAHHLHTIRVYFAKIGLGNPETEAAFDEGLNKFGYGSKK